MKIALFLIGGIILLGTMDANADDCPSGHRYLMSGRCADAPKAPPGHIMFPNAQGQNVAIKKAQNYAECLHNGRTLGYGNEQAQSYCSQHFPH